MNMRRGLRSALTAALLATVVGCGGGNAGDQALRAVEGPSDLSQFQILGLAADPTGGGWVLEGSVAEEGSTQDGTGPIVHRFREDVGLEGVADLGDLAARDNWTFVTSYGLVDGRLALGVVHCRGAEVCDSTISELVFVSPDGEISDPLELTVRPGPPSEGESVRIVGEVGESLWVLDFDGALVEVTDGSVASRGEGSGDPCVVDGALFSVAVVEGELGPEVSPTSDPKHPDRYTVSRWADGAFEPLPDGSVEAPSNSYGLCVGNAFEVFVNDESPSQLWTSDSGWKQATALPDPANPRSTHATGVSRNQFIVDEAGRLLARDRATWQETSIVFDATRTSDTPPLVLGADRSGSSVMACLVQFSEIPNDHSLECHSGVIK